MENGYIPKTWLKINAVFIPKPGKEDYSDCKSMRPICLSNFFVKTNETLIKQYLFSNQLKDPLLNQHAFTPGRSCVL